MIRFTTEQRAELQELLAQDGYTDKVTVKLMHEFWGWRKQQPTKVKKEKFYNRLNLTPYLTERLPESWLLPHQQVMFDLGTDELLLEVWLRNFPEDLLFVASRLHFADTPLLRRVFVQLVGLLRSTQLQQTLNALRSSPYWLSELCKIYPCHKKEVLQFLCDQPLKVRLMAFPHFPELLLEHQAFPMELVMAFAFVRSNSKITESALFENAGYDSHAHSVKWE